MVKGAVRSTRARLGSVLAAAALTLALGACGSDEPDTPTATTAAVATTAAATATTAADAGSTTTAAESASSSTAKPGDSTLNAIEEMTDCGTLATVKRISQSELDGATSDAAKKLYGDRVSAATERMTDLKCPAA